MDSVKEKFLEKKRNIKNLILSGGGIKGISHIGAIAALEELNIINKIETFVGTSVGSLIISLYIIGYSSAELFNFIKLFDLGKLKNINILNLSTFGLDDGSRLDFVIQKLITGKGYDAKITLKEIYEIKKKKIIFTTVCVNNMEICFKSYLTDPDLPLYLAIRMSAAIPIIYSPIVYKDKMYIDGGSVDTFPIHLFKNEIEETLGILLSEPNDEIKIIDNLETYFLRILQCLMQGLTYRSQLGYENITIKINTDSINIINYEIDLDKKEKLYKTGYESIMNNINKL